MNLRRTTDNYEPCRESALQNSDSGKYVFVRETLERCLRLSYHERIVRALPDGFGERFPDVFPVDAEALKPRYRYLTVESSGGTFCFGFQLPITYAQGFFSAGDI